MTSTPVVKRTPHLNLGQGERCRPLLLVQTLRAEAAIGDIYLPGLIFSYSSNIKYQTKVIPGRSKTLFGLGLLLFVYINKSSGYFGLSVYYKLLRKTKTPAQSVNLENLTIAFLCEQFFLF